MRHVLTITSREESDIDFLMLLLAENLEDMEDVTVHRGPDPKVKAAFKKYFESEGCGCCSNPREHRKAAKKLGKLLNFNKYSDDSGYDFYEGKYDVK
jgi:hypothetical protein